MKHKFSVVLLAIAAALCMAFGLAGCGEKSEKDPEKEQADLWSMERVYASAQELGFKGTLEELIAMFKGEKGENGKDGKDGQDGKDGLGIQSLEIDENGHLKVTSRTVRSKMWARSRRRANPPLRRAPKDCNTKYAKMKKETNIPPSSGSAWRGTRTL